MSDKRLLISIFVLAELLVIGPLAYTLVRVERQPLDVSSRLDDLSNLVQHRLLTECDPDSSQACREQAGRYIWEWSPTFLFDLKLLVEGTECNLQDWSTVVEQFAKYAAALGKEFRVPLQVESNVIFYANVELLRKGSADKITAESVKKSLHKIIDEAEVGGSGDHDERPVNLVAWSLRDNSSKSESISYRIPSWGVVSFASPLKDSLGIFRSYVREVIFGLSKDGKDMVDTRLAQKRMLGRGLLSVLKKLNATKALAESLPHLPIVSSVSVPFEEALNLVEAVMNPSTDLASALQLVRQASILSNSISSDPSLIPQLFVSDENLFAIFAPMILPTMLPLLIGCVQEVRKRIQIKRKMD